MLLMLLLLLLMMMTMRPHDGAARLLLYKGRVHERH